MANYDFHTLDDNDFELLIRDLLNAKEKSLGSRVYFESFPKGKDQGIDLLSGLQNDQPKVIVQVKHYVYSSYSKLYSYLSKGNGSSPSEVEKINKHAPERFILVTAQRLNLDNKLKIKNLFSPYITDIQDVMDQVDINQLLDEYPAVEDHHYKLWFPSVNIFQRILNSPGFGKAKYLADSIAQKMKVYVVTSHLKLASDRLRAEKVLIITGTPGIGKTSLSEMLIFKFMTDGCSLHHIYDNISDVESLLKEDDSHQLFYFDDFLGHTQYEIKQTSHLEYAFIQFLNRVQSLPNKYLLLTTRTSILNDFENRSERYRNAHLSKYKFELSVTDLSYAEKIRIIQNHLERVPEEYAKRIIEGTGLEEIAGHDNFFPRIIEFVTNEMNYRHITPKTYYGYIADQLDNPKEIWSHAWHYQIDDYDRFLLTTLFSFRAKVPASMLEETFDQRVRYEIEINHLTRINDPFIKSYKKLLGAFIRIDDAGKVDFINPSLEDYLVHYLRNNTIENLRIANSVCYVEQILHPFLPPAGKGLSLYPDEYLLRQIEKKEIRAAISNYNSDATIEATYVSLYLSLILVSFYDNKKSNQLVLAFLKRVDWTLKEAMIDGRHLVALLKRAKDIPPIRKLISPWMTYILDYIMQDYWEWDSFQETVTALEAYDGAYTVYISDESNVERIKNKMEWFVVGKLREAIDDLKFTATLDSQVIEVRNRLSDRFQALYNASGINGDFSLNSFDEEDWNKIIAQNVFEHEYYEKYF